MKNKILTALLTVAAFSGSAWAIDGTIAVSGELQTNTCAINAGGNGTTGGLSFDLSNVPVTNFKVAGNESPVGSGPGNAVVMTGCPANQQLTLLVSVDQIAKIDLTTFGFKNQTAVGSGGASNIQVILVNTDASNAVIKPTDPLGGISKTANAAGALTFNLGAKYRATGLATLGTFSATGIWEVLYQ